MLKIYLSADQLLRESLELGLRVAASGFHPDFVAGVWRGGTPVAIAVQEVLEFLGCGCDHIAIRATSYTGIGERGDVEVHGLEYLQHRLTPKHRLLIVDDVFDTGLSMAQLLQELEALCPDGLPQTRIAVPWYKPAHNQTAREPDYYLHTTGDWLVFPHELAGLAEAELLSKPGVQELIPRLLDLRGTLQKSVTGAA